ncbi:MAG: response regulator [Saprospiraceae bacterium]|nr:response regulator [Saprospiraceae bacterium]
MWIATIDGLNRYDGVSFKIFRHNEADPFSLPGDRVRHIFEDSNNLIWTLTEGGISCYESQNEKFYSFDFYQNLSQVERLDLSRMIELKHGEYCIFSSDTLYFINFEHKGLIKAENINRFQIKRYGFSSDVGEIRMVLNTGDSIWVCTQRGIWCDYGRRDEFKLVLKAQENWDFNGLWLNPQDGKLLVMAHDRLFSLAGEHWGVTHLPGIGRDHLKKGLYDGEHIYFFGKNQLYQWDNNQLNVLAYELPDLITGYVDSEGVIWLGTNTHGIRKIYPRRNRFNVFMRQTGIGGGILDDNEGVLWIQGGDGYLRLNEHEKQFKVNSFLSPQTKYVTLRKGKDNLYWGHRNDNTLMAFDLNKRLLSRHSLQDSNIRITAGIFNWERPYFLLLDENTGLIRYYPESRNIERFSLRELFEPSVTISMNILFPDRNGRIWIGSTNGLICAEPTDNGEGYNYRIWNNKGDQTQRLSDKQINFIEEDPDDPEVIWIGTQHGLNRLEIKTGEIRQFKQSDGWPSDVICGILKGNGPQLWVSTFYGLIELNTRNFQWRHFTTIHGLPSNEFNRGAAFRQKNGRLVLGCVSGLVCFYPQDIPQSSFHPRLLITNLLVNNIPITPGDSTGILKESISLCSSISLEYDQSNVTFHFALLDFLNPSWNRYYYKLEGVDNVWQYNGSESKIQYVNLSPGYYKFWVKARNSDGYWSGPVGIDVVVRPPWWRTTWAYVLFGAVFLLLVWQGLRLWIRQVRLRDRLAVKQMEADRLKELDNFRSELYANITHEFRTPLTIILGIADQLHARLEGEMKEGVKILTRNGQQLLRLINQILDLSKIEQRHLELNPVQLDIIGFIKYLGESYAALARQKEIEFQVQTSLPELKMDVDVQRMQEILDNLLSNAFKFTPKGGTVSIEIGVLAGKKLIIHVKDTGIGIEPEHLDRIFDRYYQVNRTSLHSSGGSGIGLAYTRALAEIMGGFLHVRSTPGEGSVFTLELPIKNDTQGTPTPPLQPGSLVNVGLPAMGQEPLSQLPLVLIVEDNDDVASYIASCLTGQYQVRMANNGKMGEELAFELIPDIIISDIAMPDRNGLELCKRLKNDRRSSHIPIILLTARTDTEQRIRGLELGANLYLTKPFYQKELLLHLQNLLQWRSDMQKQWASLEKSTESGLYQTAVVETETLDSSFVQQMLNVIEEKYTEPDFSVSDICRAMVLSNAQLHRKINALTGKSPGYYLRQRRLSAARVLLLQHKHLSIAEIAYQVGYSDPSYFARVFSAEYGCSPAKYRGDEGKITANKP